MHIIGIVLSIFAMTAIVPLMQNNLGDLIDDDLHNKKYLIKMNFFIKPIGGGKVSDNGVIYSMLYLHIFGYIVGFFSTVLMIILTILNYPLTNMFYLSTIVLGIEVIIIISIVAFISFIDKKRMQK
ncbi:MAG: hypothetical protein PQJ44_01460 [Sphaerochaetaceae bacterium]|nr:hypothetical protein [Sphaerochaetaceae bacterium]